MGMVSPFREDREPRWIAGRKGINKVRKRECATPFTLVVLDGDKNEKGERSGESLTIWQNNVFPFSSFFSSFASLPTSEFKEARNCCDTFCKRDVTYPTH